MNFAFIGGFSFIFVVSGALQDKHWTPCCNLAVNESLRKECRRAKMKQDVSIIWETEAESQFLSCLRSIHMVERCCPAGCLKECVLYNSGQPFLSLPKCLSIRERPKLDRCVHTQLKALMAKTSCCHNLRRGAATDGCVAACNEVIGTTKASLENLFRACGQTLQDMASVTLCLNSPNDASGSSESAVGKNPSSASLRTVLGVCCNRASSSCQKECQATFENRGSFKTEFLKLELECVHGELGNCLNEALSPCRQGCRTWELKFCRDLVDPNAIYRNCDTKADERAAARFRSWKETGGRTLKPQWILPVFGFYKCHPDAWRRLACIIEFQPCSARSFSSIVCREDCRRLAQDCFSSGPSAKLNLTDKLCDDGPWKDWVVDSSSDCTPLFLGNHQRMPLSTATMLKHGEDVFPCRKEPCKVNEICLVNRKASPGTLEPLYTCHPGCRIKMALRHTPRHGSFHVKRGESVVSQGKVCNCSHSNQLKECRPFKPKRSYFPEFCHSVHNPLHHISSSVGSLVGLLDLEDDSYAQLGPTWVVNVERSLSVWLSTPFCRLLIRGLPSELPLLVPIQILLIPVEADFKELCDVELELWRRRLTTASVRKEADPVLRNVNCVQLLPGFPNSAYHKLIPSSIFLLCLVVTSFSALLFN